MTGIPKYMCPDKLCIRRQCKNDDYATYSDTWVCIASYVTSDLTPATFVMSSFIDICVLPEFTYYYIEIIVWDYKKGIIMISGITETILQNTFPCDTKGNAIRM